MIDWSSDVCAADLHRSGPAAYRPSRRHAARMARGWRRSYAERRRSTGWHRDPVLWTAFWTRRRRAPLSFADRTDTSTRVGSALGPEAVGHLPKRRSDEPTSELQSLMRNSYAVFCLKK